jgi:hypothetical protein
MKNAVNLLQSNVQTLVEIGKTGTTVIKLVVFHQHTLAVLMKHVVNLLQSNVQTLVEFGETDTTVTKLVVCHCQTTSVNQLRQLLTALGIY